MEVVTGATGRVLSQLGELLREEYKLQTNVKNDIEYLRKEQTFMRAALRKVAQVTPELLDEQVNAWASHVKELSYDMVDAIDTFRVRVEANKAADNDSLSLVKPLKKMERFKARRQLAEEIESMKCLTKELAEMRNRYLLDNTLSKPMQDTRGSQNNELLTWLTDHCNISDFMLRAELLQKIIGRLYIWWAPPGIFGQDVNHEKSSPPGFPTLDMGPYISYMREKAHELAEWPRRCAIKLLNSSDDEIGDWFDPGRRTLENHQTSRQLIELREVVGVPDKDMKKLETWFAQEDKDGKTAVLYITGSPGVGKTTIAKALYGKFGGRFDCRAMVTDSGSYRTDELMKSILDQVRLQVRHVKHGGSGHNKGSVSNCWWCPTNRVFKACGPQRGTSASVSVETSNKYPPERKSLKERRTSTTRINRAPYNTDELQARHVKQSCSVDNQDSVCNCWWCPTNRLSKSCGSQSGTCTNDGPSLKEHLKTELEERSCLLFIDNCDAKTDFRGLLPTDNGCKIIATTRLSSVTWGNDDCDEIHNVKILDHKQSKMLFMDVLSESRDCIKDFERKGLKNIPARLWKLCGGHPLAIMAMAGLVACNGDKSLDAWEQVCCMLVPDYARVLNQDSILRLLNHCYNDMSAENKTCSLYLSMYPIGSRIGKKRLTRRWLAEGFLGEKPRHSANDVAEACFNQLIARKFLQPVECNRTGNVKSCQIYELVHDYIVFKANEENFSTAVGGDSTPMGPTGRKVRRLSLPKGESLEKAEKEMDVSHVRSLAMSATLESTTKILSSSNFPILQVLDLEGCSDFKDPKEIYKMLLLKYLSLRGTGIKELHQKIEKLNKLETLDIRETGITSLPKTIYNLKSLVNLLGGNRKTRVALKLPPGAKNMESLRTLSGIEISVEIVDNVNFEQFISKLKKLVIYKLQINQGHQLSSILNSSYLRSLIIYDESEVCELNNFDFDSTPKSLIALELYGKLDKLLNWKQLRDLRKLTLPITMLQEATLKELSSLSYLFSLSFSYFVPEQDPKFPLEQKNDKTANILERNKAPDEDNVVPEGFPNLKILCFSAPMVPQLSFEEKAMPNLEKIELRFINLEGLHGLHNLKSLKKLHMVSHNNADRFTTSIIQGIQAAQQIERVIVDQYSAADIDHKCPKCEPLVSSS